MYRYYVETNEGDIVEVYAYRLVGLKNSAFLSAHLEQGSMALNKPIETEFDRIKIWVDEATSRVYFKEWELLDINEIDKSVPLKEIRQIWREKAF